VLVTVLTLLAHNGIIDRVTRLASRVHSNQALAPTRQPTEMPRGEIRTDRSSRRTRLA